MARVCVICRVYLIMYSFKSHIVAQKVTSVMCTYHICTTIHFFLQTMDHRMVADGSIGRGFSIVGFHLA